MDRQKKKERRKQDIYKKKEKAREINQDFDADAAKLVNVKKKKGNKFCHHAGIYSP